MEIQTDKRSVVVKSDGKVILMATDFPSNELINQLKIWLSTVTEEKAESFIFISNKKEHIGIFRIEPRERGWQFTSTKEITRSSELLSLKEWREVLNSVA